MSAGPGDARLVDQRLARVDRRRGVGTSMLALGRHTARRMLGLRRPLRHKVLPMLFAGIAYLPAVAFLGVAALLPGQLAGEILPTPVDFYGSILFAVILFTALAGPQALCPDRRHRTLGLYLASPLDRTTYLLASGGALVGTLLVVTLGPPLLARVGFALLGVPGPTLPLAVARIVASGVLLALLYAMVGLAGASLTDRRGFASAGIFFALVGLSIVTEVLQETLSVPDGVLLLDVAGLGVAVVTRIHGEQGEVMRGLATGAVMGGAVLWIVGLAALVHWRYRRLQVVR